MVSCKQFAAVAVIFVVSVAGVAQSRKQTLRKSAPASSPQSQVQIVRVEPAALVVRKTTPVKLVMPYPVSLSASTVGDLIKWDVAEDVVVDGAAMIPKGSTATAKVTTIFNSGYHPRLSMTLETVHLPTGDVVPIAADMSGNRYLNFTTTLTNDAVVPDGTEITAYLASDFAVRPVQAPVQLGEAKAKVPENQVVLHGATPVVLKFARKITSEYAQDGDRIAFRVAEPVCIGDLIAIRKGAIAWGTVTEVHTSRDYGRKGKIFVRLDFVRLANDERTLLTAVMAAEGKGKEVETVGVTPFHVIAGGVMAAITEGHDIAIAEGTEITAYVKDDVVLDGSKLPKD